MDAELLRMQQTHEVPPRRLLIADDSAEMRWIVRAAVGAEFGEVVEAVDGRELFWEMLRASFADKGSSTSNLVVITDLCMPSYDGLEVLDAWSDFEHRVPTILITAFPTDAVRAHAQTLGVCLLAKPFSTRELRRVLHEVIDDQRRG
ncbi:MAG: response regulator [Proteobacteria bacterium]|nr:response regulator [Pseudomonadota bacterium]